VNGPPTSDTVKVVALIVLGVIVGLGIVAVTVVAVATDRAVSGETKALAAGILCIAIIGGMAFSRGRWRNDD